MFDFWTRERGTCPGGKVTRVAIILVNWNGLEDTLACLESLAAQSYRDCTIIVVDNGSSEDVSLIAMRHPEVVLIRNQENLGFSGGNNIGIRKAAELGTEYCWILNNDTEVAPDCLARLVQALDNDAGLAAVAHPIFYFYDRRLQWFAGGIFRHGLPTHREFMKPKSDASLEEDVDGISDRVFIPGPNARASRSWKDLTKTISATSRMSICRCG